MRVDWREVFRLGVWVDSADGRVCVFIQLQLLSIEYSGFKNENENVRGNSRWRIEWVEMSVPSSENEMVCFFNEFLEDF